MSGREGKGTNAIWSSRPDKAGSPPLLLILSSLRRHPPLLCRSGPKELPCLLAEGKGRGGGEGGTEVKADVRD